MEVLVTGGTGFIGHRLAEKLIEAGVSVRCLVRPTSKYKNLQEMGAEICYGDLGQPESLVRAVNGINTIYHLAGNSQPSLVKPYKIYQKTNVEGTKNLLDAAVQAGVRKMVIMSSIAATGPSRDGKPLTEKSLRKPITKYGKSKKAVEDLAMEYYREKDLPLVIIRPPMVYGIGDRDWLGFFSLLKGNGLFGLGLPIPGDHTNLFDFCYVDNLVQGIIDAAKSNKTDGAIYFLSDERPYEVREIIAAVRKEFGLNYPQKYWSLWFAILLTSILDTIGLLFRFDSPLARRDIRWMTQNYWICDVSKAKRDFNYQPQISLEEGISRTLRWADQNGYL